jgi:hypothetical protein
VARAAPEPAVRSASETSRVDAQNCESKQTTGRGEVTRCVARAKPGRVAKAALVGAVPPSWCRRRRTRTAAAGSALVTSVTVGGMTLYALAVWRGPRGDDPPGPGRGHGGLRVADHHDPVTVVLQTDGVS